MVIKEKKSPLEEEWLPTYRNWDNYDIITLLNQSYEPTAHISNQFTHSHE